MSKSLQRRFRVLVTAAAVGLTVWKQAPRLSGFSEFDRAVFEVSVRAFSNPPFFVSGNGSHEQSWSLRTLSSEGSGSGRETLPVISIGDDPDGFFQSSPPEALDVAVILRNLKRLGVRRVALADQMVWDQADPNGLVALDARLADFDSTVTTAALTRGAEAAQMPLPFHLASIPVTSVKGDVALLPQVNRISLPGTYLGSGKTLAGFSILENETGSPALLARWKDRIVFSFPVIAALAEAGQKAADIEVRLGSYLKLGPGGPVIPIDAQGRLASRPVRFSTKVIPMQSLIDAKELASNGSVMLRNDRRTADPEIRSFSEGAADCITSFVSETGLSKPRIYSRLSDPAESAMVLGLSVVLFLCTTKSVFRLRLAFGFVLAAILIAQLAGLAWFDAWLPLYPSLSAIAAGYLVAWPMTKPSVSAHSSLPTPPANPEPEPVPVMSPPSIEPEVIAPSEDPQLTGEDPPPAPAKKTARKAAKKAAKKTASTETDPDAPKPAKKVAKKAAPAKKAAKKAASTEKPPAKKAAKKVAKKAPKPPEPE